MRDKTFFHIGGSLFLSNQAVNNEIISLWIKNKQLLREREEGAMLITLI